MTEYIIDENGGEYGFSYGVTASCSNTAVTWTATQTSANWFTWTANNGMLSVSCEEAEGEVDKSITLTPSVNGNSCSSKIIRITQRGISPCTCDNFESIGITYIIPSSGASSGTAIGSYTITGGCDESNIHFVSVLSLYAENGSIKLGQDVPPNTSTTSFIYSNVEVYYGQEIEPCYTDTVAQEASQVKCGCEYIETFMTKLHSYFSNLAYNPSVPSTSAYTPLNDVLIMSATTACGEFAADASSMSGLSTTIKGQTVPSKVLLEESGNSVYGYVSILPQSSASDPQRSFAIQVSFKEKGASTFEDCGKPIYLYQSPTEYTNCNVIPDVIPRSTLNYELFTGSGCHETESLCEYDDTNEVSDSINYSRFKNLYPKTALKPKIIEVGYCSGIARDISSASLCNYGRIPYCHTPGTETAVTVSDFSTWGTIRPFSNYLGDELYVSFKEPNNTNYIKYIKVGFDIYTDTAEKFNPTNGVYCKPLEGFYRWALQLPQNFGGCQYPRVDSTKMSFNTVDVIPPKTITGILPHRGDGGYDMDDYYWGGENCKVTDVYLVPSTAGEVQITYTDSTHQEVESYNIVFSANTTDTNYIVEVYETVKCGNETCSNDILTRKYRVMRGCPANCDNLSSYVNTEYSVVGEAVDPSVVPEYSEIIKFDESEITIRDEQGRLYKTHYYETDLSFPTSKVYCDNLYLVFCDVNGNNEDIDPDILRKGFITYMNGNTNSWRINKDCWVSGKGWKLRFYDSSFTFQLQLYFDGQLNNNGERYWNPGFYYKIKLYDDNGNHICTSNVYGAYNHNIYRTCIDSVYCSTAETKFSEINYKVPVIREDSLTKIPIDTSGCSNLNIVDFVCASGSTPPGGYCNSVILNYTVHSSQADIDSGITLSGKELRVTIPPNTTSDYRPITYDVAFQIGECTFSKIIYLKQDK